MSIDIEAIQARAEAAAVHEYDGITDLVYGRDVKALIAEVERLKSANKELDKAQHDLFMEYTAVKKERDAAVEEIPRTAHNCAHAKNCERARIDNRKCPKCHAWEWRGERSGE